MADEIFVVTRVRPKPARFQLPDEEWGDLMNKLGALFQETGVEHAIRLGTHTGSPWRWIQIHKFPSLGAWSNVRKDAVLASGLWLGLEKY